MDKLSLMPFEYGPTRTGMAIEFRRTIARVGLEVVMVGKVNMVGLTKIMIIGHGLEKCLAIGQLDSIVSSKIPMLSEPNIVEELKWRIVA